MKTENTPENKAAFFAQYYVKDFIAIETKTGFKATPIDAMKKYWIHGYHLELRRIVQIDGTHEEEVMSSFIMNPEVDESAIDNVFGNVERGTLATIDFLRSKGYATPWRDLSVSDLVEYGWIKLKE